MGFLSTSLLLADYALIFRSVLTFFLEVFMHVRCVCPYFFPGPRPTLRFFLWRWLCCFRFPDSDVCVTRQSHCFHMCRHTHKSPATRVTPFVRQDVGPNVLNVPGGQKRTPLERELEKVDGICLQQLGQPVAAVCGRVSVVTPTTASRARFHPQLWQCFVDQSWPDKELVVIETYHDQPSAFFQHIALMDKRLKYIAIKRPVGEDLTVGAKRNLTILLASGQYIVNFDDDDLYGDRYVQRLVDEMKQRNLVALTLSGWHNFFEARGSAGYSGPN